MLLLNRVDLFFFILKNEIEKFQDFLFKEFEFKVNKISSLDFSFDDRYNNNYHLCSCLFIYWVVTGE